MLLCEEKVQTTAQTYFLLGSTSFEVAKTHSQAIAGTYYWLQTNSFDVVKAHFGDPKSPHSHFLSSIPVVGSEDVLIQDRTLGDIVIDLRDKKECTNVFLFRCHLRGKVTIQRSPLSFKGGCGRTIGLNCTWNADEKASVTPTRLTWVSVNGCVPFGEGPAEGWYGVRMANTGHTALDLTGTLENCRFQGIRELFVRAKFVKDLETEHGATLYVSGSETKVTGVSCNVVVLEPPIWDSELQKRNAEVATRVSMDPVVATIRRQWGSRCVV
jgi:hypothetical protein